MVMAELPRERIRSRFVNWPLAGAYIRKSCKKPLTMMGVQLYLCRERGMVCVQGEA